MRVRSVGLLAALLASHALAVSLGPLEKSGTTDGPGKAFYLTLGNPEAKAARLRIEAFERDGKTVARRVSIFPPDTILGSGGTRKLLIVAQGLAPGETYTFRVCAYRPPEPKETILARVCSKLTAHRLPAGL